MNEPAEGGSSTADRLIVENIRLITINLLLIIVRENTMQKLRTRPTPDKRFLFTLDLSLAQPSRT